MTSKKKNIKIQTIVVSGARVHNLKNVSVTLPRNKLIVFTGVSGSGKSSLAFDTIYAEGQRRYVESLSSYARQFLERMQKPDVDFIQGLSPAIAIEQKNSTKNPRSTVATTTEIYDYLRLLFGRIGKTYCKICGKLVQRNSVSSVVDKINLEPEDSKIYICFPLIIHKSKKIEDEFGNLKSRGFFRLLIKNDIVDLNENIPVLKSTKNIFVLVDRIILRKNDKEIQTRLADSINTAFEESGGYVNIVFLDSKKNLEFSKHYECIQDKISYVAPEPRMFSFNNPIGACPTCQGFGITYGIDMQLVIPNPSKSIRENAIYPWSSPAWNVYNQRLIMYADKYGIDVDMPIKKFSKEQYNVIIQGTKDFDGIIDFFKMIERKSYQISYKMFYNRYRNYTKCIECEGARLKKESLNIYIANKNIKDIVVMNIEEAYNFFNNIELDEFDKNVAKRILEEIRKRLKYLFEIGLGYLTLDRLTSSLSGGESQRINLATAIGSSLMGALYVLDEPTIGLHPKDNSKLISTLKTLKNLGNTVLVVEHDYDMICEADYIVDIGPKAGEHGGNIVFNGTYKELLECKSSLTSQYITGVKKIEIPRTRIVDSEKSIFIRNAYANNLKNIDVRIPLNMFVCVTGVSGSGKSTLVHDVLYTELRNHFASHIDNKSNKCEKIEGIENIKAVELIDQTSIGRNTRSNPLTYLEIYDHVRTLFANTHLAKSKKICSSDFSFNIPGGRCDVCEGTGVQQIEMQFLADIFLPCESCKGKRFKNEILNIRYLNKNIDEVFNLTVTEAIDFFTPSNNKHIISGLKTLDNVGLGYLKLGQSSTTFSGGEAQRMKLAQHLNNAGKKENTLFIFDEPTTGLHFDDVSKLMKCFDMLIQAGHSLIVIEHNMDVVKCADFVIDLGPGAGKNGGEIIAAGTPEEVSKNPKSYTGVYLKKYI